MEEENERYKNCKDILLDNWISPRLLWRGKVLVFTRHIISELEKLNKNYEYALDLLEKGEHRLVSKKQNKYEVFYPYKSGYLHLVYAYHEKIILIHIKPIKRKK